MSTNLCLQELRLGFNNLDMEMVSGLLSALSRARLVLEEVLSPPVRSPSDAPPALHRRSVPPPLGHSRRPTTSSGKDKHAVQYPSLASFGSRECASPFVYVLAIARLVDLHVLHAYLLQAFAEQPLFEAVLSVLDLRCNNIAGHKVEQSLCNMIQHNDTLRDVMLQVSRLHAMYSCSLATAYVGVL